MSTPNFKRTKLACYTAYFTMSSIFSLPPILFVTLRDMYGISYTLLGTLVLTNFFTQLSIDLIFTFFSKYFNVKKIVREVFADKALCFIGYTDACAYIVDDVMISEGGYEPTSSLEYGLKGNFKPGISQKLREGFENARKQNFQ